MKKNPAYLIKLYGVKTTYLKVINEDIWQWLKNEKNCPQTLVLNNHCKNSQEKAIHAPGKTFTSLSRLKTYLKDNNLELVDEFRCMDY